jgi:hypothetical protein
MVFSSHWIETLDINTKLQCAILLRHEEDWSPSGGLRWPDSTLIELDLKIGAESVQLLLRQIIDGAPQW